MARMEIINSNDKKVPSAEIVVEALQQISSRNLHGGGEYPLASAMAAIIKEGSLDTADSIQIGNTVFLAHRGKGANKNKMVGKAFNIDTGKNYLNNCLEYFEYLRKKGITHYTTMFSDPEILKLLQVLQRTMKDIDTNVYIAKENKGGFIAYVRFGDDPISRIS